MSQIISDFIIEPVVRQARRFSWRDSTAPAVVATTTDAEFPEYVNLLVEADDTALVEQESEDQTESTGLASVLEQEQHDTRETPVDVRDRAATDSEALGREPRPQALSRARYTSSNASFPSTRNDAGLRMMEDSTMSTASSNTRTSGGNPAVDLRLPADDGMGYLRKRILEVHDSDISSDEKSRLVHQIMLEQYVSTGGSTGVRTQSPSSVPSHDRPLTPNSRLSADLMQIESPERFALSAASELNVTTEDVTPTYWIPPPASVQATPDQSRKNSIDEERQFGCEHYKRNVKLQCSTCFKWYTCRFCHDRAEDHCLNRQATRNMLCMNCGVPQPAAADCSNCGFSAAYYYCKVCKLWDDDSTKSIYHCDACGICRRGKGLGKDFFHCQKCSACISMRLLDNHKCIERSTDCDCPICGEYMFTSLKTVVFMRCGHTIHYHCWTEHMKNSYKCPICSKSMVNMDLTFRQYDNDIEAQPMPPQFRDTRALIFCNDCTNKSLVAFHWIGSKCPTCDSYNTVRLQTISAPENVDLGEAETDHPVPAPPAIISGQHILASEDQVNVQAPVIISEIITSTDPVTDTSTESRRVGSYTQTTIVTQTDTSVVANGEDEEDDVDFWGGTSPRERAMLESLTQEEEEEEEEEEDSDSQESTDQEMEIIQEDEDDEDDQMAIFGHR